MFQQWQAERLDSCRKAEHKIFPAQLEAQFCRLKEPSGSACAVAEVCRALQRRHRHGGSSTPPGMPHGRLQLAGYRLMRAGYRRRPGWRASERAMWAEAAALDPGEDPALRSFHDEGVRSLKIFDLVRRVIAAASAP